MAASILKKIINQKWRRVIRDILENIVAHIISIKSRFGKYNFSSNEVKLYFSERRIALPTAKTDTNGVQSGKIKVTLGGIQIIWPKEFPIDDLPWLHHEIFDPFLSNPSSYDHPKMAMNEKNWILDAGAAEGYFSVFSAMNSSPETRIIVVEPLQELMSSINDTLLLNGCEKFELIQCALGDESAIGTFEIDTEHFCDSKIVDSSDLETGTSTTNVEIKTIDEIANSLSLKGGGLIKMDIEGFEMKALLGARKLMKTHKPSFAIAVYHDEENAEKCAEIIQAANPLYKIEYRGYYGYFGKGRPYMLFAY